MAPNQYHCTTCERPHEPTELFVVLKPDTSHCLCRECLEEMEERERGPIQ